MCSFCEKLYRDDVGGCEIMPIPSVWGRGGGMALHYDEESGFWSIMSTNGAVIAGPIRYCPMCSRRLEAGEEPR